MAVEEPFCPRTEHSYGVDVCAECGMERGFGRDGLGDIDVVAKKVRQEGAAQIIDWLQREKKENLSELERIFQLPQRTLHGWKADKDMSAVAVAFLRLLRVAPWLIDVAENGYDETSAHLAAMGAIGSALVTSSTLSFARGAGIEAWASEAVSSPGPEKSVEEVR